MFLQPHHFQASDRHWGEVLQTSDQFDHHYNYGIRSVRLSEEAISNNQMQLDACQARFKDGTVLSIEIGQEPDRVDLKQAFDKPGAPETIDLKQAFETEKSVRVYLAIPKLKMGSVNVAQGNEVGSHRFCEEVLSFQDESRGGNDQDIPFRVPSVKLLLSTQDLAGYELLPIAQIERSGEGEASPRIDPNYFPPLLAIDAWSPLSRDIVRAIYDIVGQKLEVLGEQVLNRGITLDTQEPGDLDRVMMLSQLNSGYSTLGVLAFAQGVHPFQAYTELCRLLGMLSIFGPTRRAVDVPPYDHDDLARIFQWVKQEIELRLNAVREFQYEQRFFIGSGLGMQVSLEAKWFNADWNWFVGVSCDELSSKECRELLSAGHLDWKLGSSRQVEILFRHGAEGLRLLPLEQAPRALPTSKNCVFYEVSRGNAAWKDVQETQTLAMRLKDSLILNRDSLQGERTLQVMYTQKKANLQFALFAVPQ